ncbi:DUF4347 domain-containing protein [Shewanella schlegeliana]|uniref:DUF4347 domain-containing protein n=1 Tax=Shewanella schlegeliana TaxID=190308 RepID=A0ABS1SWE3_9GAMM|nr:DUF4347 domain-containing protein [Shewanella schlegeliana]MBL4912714.1 DUF4347 domain-containing protein [Shewanella schlegeliana]MCL1109776.1 DUF4347 domain-containing protein [Shewanella schlegeliana]GIU30344.1 hypothetical protein TUM4433_20720 [Shewanella schlegeliana]
MNVLKHVSRYSTFNDSLTAMKIFKGTPFSQWFLTRGSSNRKPKYRRTHEFPFYWLLLLCVLLLINSVIAAAKESAPTKLNGAFAFAEQSISLIIVDRRLEQVERILSGVRGELHLLILEEDIEPFEQINQALYDEPLYSNVTIVAKASSSAIYLGGRWIDKNYLLEHQSSLNLFGEQFSDDSELTLYTTNLITTHYGQEFIGVLASLTQLNVDIVHIKGAQEEPLWVNRTQFSF